MLETIKSMLKKTLNFAVVGCGNIGKRHVDLLLKNDDVRLIAACDTDEAKKKILPNSVSFTTNFEEILDHKNIEVVNICTPHHLHAPMSIAALRAGKHVLVEKPMCINSKDAKQMIVASEKYNRRLIVVKQNRYNFPVQQVNELLAKKKLGKIIEVHCHILWNRNDDYYQKSDWRGKLKTEAGALFTQGSHFIDLLVHWFGEVKKSQTWMATLNHKIELEDSGNSTLIFENGTIGKLLWSNNVFEENYEGSITIFGEKGTVKIGGAYLNQLEYWNVKNIPQPQITTSDDAPNRYASGYQGSSSNHHKVFEDVVNLLLHHKKVKMVEGEDAVKTITSIEKIYKSAK